MVFVPHVVDRFRKLKKMVRVIVTKRLGSAKKSPAVQDLTKKITTSEDDALGQGFQVVKLVAKGAFGKVYLVRKISTMQFLAMKVIPKDKWTMMMDEEGILSKLDHSFVVRLRHSFRTESKLFLIFDFINGGDLHFHISRRVFREDIVRFYAAELVAAVAYLHAKGIMHRDIKPANILLDSEGHIVLTDFGMAKEFDMEKAPNPRILSHRTCGTLDFMAPEIVLGHGYGMSADWWSVGVSVYVMLTGKLPFKGKTPRDVEMNIVSGKLVLPEYLSREAHSLLKGLLTKGPGVRLGEGGSGEIKKHKWFSCIDWEKLEVRGYQPELVPRSSGTECTAN